MFGRRTDEQSRTRVAGPPPRTFSAVSRFMLGSLTAVAVVVVGGFFALRSVAIKEAENSTRDQVATQGQLVEAAGLRDGLLRGDPGAIAHLDDLVHGRILDNSLVRVKVWAANGTILYSDEPALIGQRFALLPDELRLFSHGGSAAELSDLSKPENRYERKEGKLLEAHTAIRTPNGTQVLFEIYQRFGSINASSERLLRGVAPPLLAGLVVLVLFQVPLAWSMARRLQRGHTDRERLLAAAVDASSQERRRIAADLHDGAVQDLAGVAFGLAPLADEAARRGDQREASTLRDAISRLRQAVRELRTLLVEIHPRSLESTGLEAALNDLLSPLEAQGVTTELHVDEHATARSNADALVYRVAREAVRNVQAHAGATSARVELSRPTPGTARLVVKDDGRGFAAAERQGRAANGHVGLTLIESLVREAGGTLEVRSEPGQGTTVELEAPTQ